MWQFVTVALGAALLVVLVRHQLLKRELTRMARAMNEIHSQHTNRQLTIGVQQAGLASLAVAVNQLYNDVDAEKAAHRAAMDDLRQSMANISHDLRTPLTSILGYLKLLQGNDNTPEQRQRYLEVAYAKAGALNRLVGGLFELARLESGGYAFRRQRLDAVALLGEELAGVYTQMQAQSLTPAVQLPDAPLWVVGDSEALARVYANLLGNMVKHGAMPLSVEAGAEGGEAVFRFANRAPGVTEEDTARLFHRFFTGDRMRSGENTGLGLSIVQEFVQQMGGSIGAELKADILVFTLRFPLTV